MRKQEFLEKLHFGLSGLPQEEIRERLTFYREMIDDRMEEGLSEEEAVAAVGSVEEIVAQAVNETPLSKIAREKIRSRRRFSGLEIVLLVLGFPIWFSLLVAAAAVVFSVYVSIWAVIISLWAVFVSMVVSSVAVIAGGAVLCCFGSKLPGIAMIGIGIACMGLSIFIFFGCKAVSDGILSFTQKTTLSIKNRFLKKEVA